MYSATGPAGGTRSKSRANSEASSQASLPGSYADTDNEETPIATKVKGKTLASERVLDFTAHLGYFKEKHPQPARFSNSGEFIKELANPQQCKGWYEALIDMIIFHDAAIVKHQQTQQEKEKIKKECDALRTKCDELTTSRDKFYRKHSEKKNLLDAQNRAYAQMNKELRTVKEALSGMEMERNQAYQDVERLQREETAEQRPSNTQIQEPFHGSEDYQSEIQEPVIQNFTPEPLSNTKVTKTDDVSSSWRPRGTDPSKSLSGKHKDDYAAWAYTVKRKVETDSPIYPTDSTKIDYALSKMTDPLFDAMLTWVQDQINPTWVNFFEEIEHYLGLHMQGTEAKHQLASIKMKNDESVDEYYHRIYKLWQKAGVSEVDRIRQFIVTLRPLYSASLVSITFTKMRDLLDRARTIEDRKKEIGYTHFDNNQSKNRGTGSNNQSSSTSGNTTQPRSNQTNAAAANTTKLEGRASNPNAKFMPCLTRPEGWVGKWYGPEDRPRKLDEKGKEELMKAGRCWACRASGHRSWETIKDVPVCPQAKKKMNTQTVEESSSDSESEKGKA